MAKSKKSKKSSSNDEKTVIVIKTKVVNDFSMTDLLFYGLIPGGQNLVRMAYYNSTTDQSFWMIPFFNLPIVQMLPLFVMQQTMKVSESKRTTNNIFKYVVLLIPIGVKIAIFKMKNRDLSESLKYLIMLATTTVTMLIYNIIACGTFNLGLLSKSIKSGVLFSVFPEVATHLSARSKIINMLVDVSKKYRKNGEEKKSWTEPAMWVFYYSYLASTLAMTEINEKGTCKAEMNYSSIIMVTVIAFLAYKVKMNTNESCSLF